MTYDGGRQDGPTRKDTLGVYFSYAPHPWGPWAAPQLIFHSCRDKGFGHFMYYYSSVGASGNCPTAVKDGMDHAGPSGPTIGDQTKNAPTTTPGDPYAPYMIERFTEVGGDTLEISYTMSTWNPYTVVLMESDFKVARLW